MGNSGEGVEEVSQGLGVNVRVLLTNTTDEMLRLYNIFKERAVREG